MSGSPESIINDTLEHAFNIVANNADLRKTTEEGLGSGKTVNVSNTEDIVVFFVLQGLVVNIKETILSSQTSFDEIFVWLGRHK